VKRTLERCDVGRDARKKRLVAAVKTWCEECSRFTFHKGLGGAVHWWWPAVVATVESSQQPTEKDNVGGRGPRSELSLAAMARL
jgi:hypothetical protein